MPTKPVVLVTERIADVGLQLLDKSCEVCAPWRQNRTHTEEELGAADALIVRLFKITAAMCCRRRRSLKSLAATERVSTAWILRQQRKEESRSCSHPARRRWPTRWQSTRCR